MTIPANVTTATSDSPGDSIETPSGVYTFAQAARRLGLELATAYRLDNAGQFPVDVVHFGALRKVRVAELERFLEGPAPTEGLEALAERSRQLTERLRSEQPMPAPTLTLIRGGLAE